MCVILFLVWEYSQNLFSSFYHLIMILTSTLKRKFEPLCAHSILNKHVQSPARGPNPARDKILSGPWQLHKREKEGVELQPKTLYTHTQLHIYIYNVYGRNTTPSFSLLWSIPDSKKRKKKELRPAEVGGKEVEKHMERATK